MTGGACYDKGAVQVWNCNRRSILVGLSQTPSCEMCPPCVNQLGENSGSLEAFFEEVRDNPSPTESGGEYTGEITHTEVIDKIAQVTMKEKGYLGLNFSNLFHLACIDGNWLIICKTYIQTSACVST